MCSFTFTILFRYDFLGADRLMDDIEHMIGFRLGKHWYICWKFITPLLLIVRICVLTHLCMRICVYNFYNEDCSKIILKAELHLLSRGIFIYKNLFSI